MTPLKILQVLPNLVSGGVEVGTIDIAKALVEGGNKAYVASNGGPLVTRLEQAGAIHIHLPVHSKNPFVMWKNARTLRRLCSKYNIDIVHARSRAPAWSCYWASQKLKSTIMITTFHGTYGHHNSLKRWYNSIMLQSQQTIAVSDFIKDHILTTYPNKQTSIEVIHRGIDTQKFNPENVPEQTVRTLAKTWAVPNNAKVIMLPGRITRWKGHSVLIQAIAKLKQENIFCLMVGDDQGKTAYQEELDKLILEHQLEHKVRFVGGCSDMPSAYKLADIVVSASTEPEAFGRVACEAQAMNCLVVVTDHGGGRETIATSQEAFLCHPNDVDSLSQSLSRALKIDKQTTEDIYLSSRKHISQHFSLQHMCEKTIAVYNKNTPKTSQRKSDTYAHNQNVSKQ